MLSGKKYLSIKVSLILIIFSVVSFFDKVVVCSILDKYTVWITIGAFCWKVFGKSALHTYWIDGH